MRRSPLNPEIVALFAAGALPQEALASVLAPYLVGHCGACRQESESFEPLVASTTAKRAEDLPRAWVLAMLGLIDPAKALPHELRAARSEVRTLARLPPERRVPHVVRSRTRFRTPALVGLLIEECRGASRTDPPAAFGWLDLAHEVCLHLFAAGYDECVLDPLELRIQAHRANAHRVAGDLGAADRAFEQLATDPRRSTLAPLEVHAELASLEASLCLDQRRFEDSDRLLGRAVNLYRAASDALGVVRVLIKRAGSYRLRGRVDEAVEHLLPVFDLLKPDVHSDLYLAAQSNLALCLVERGTPEAAREILERNRPLYDARTDPWTRARRAWLEGRVARGLGEEETAEEQLTAARQDFLAEGNGFNAALVSLDLAELYLEHGRTAEVKRLAEQMAPVFEARDVHSEAARALELFGQAAAAEQLTLALVARLRGYLEQARGNPRLRFQARS